MAANFFFLMYFFPLTGWQVNNHPTEQWVAYVVNNLEDVVHSLANFQAVPEPENSVESPRYPSFRLPVTGGNAAAFIVPGLATPVATPANPRRRTPTRRRPQRQPSSPIYNEEEDPREEELSIGTSGSDSLVDTERDTAVQLPIIEDSPEDIAEDEKQMGGQHSPYGPHDDRVMARFIASHRNWHQNSIRENMARFHKAVGVCVHAV
jgi:hypothetical protein